MGARRRDAGFTAIELSVVVLIIGVLVLAAIPMFTGSSRRAHDRKAQSAVVIAHRAQQVHRTKADDTTFTTAPEELLEAEPTLTYEPVPAVPASTSTTVVATRDTAFVQTTPDASVTCVSTVSASGRIFSVKELPNGEVVYRAAEDLPVCDTDPEGWTPDRW